MSKNTNQTIQTAQYNTTFAELGKRGPIDPIKGLNMVPSDAVRDYFGVPKEVYDKALNKCRSDLKTLGAKTMAAKVASEGLEIIETLPTGGYRVRLESGASWDMPVNIRLYYTAPAVARLGAELNAEEPKPKKRGRKPHVAADDARENVEVRTQTAPIMVEDERTEIRTQSAAIMDEIFGDIEDEPEAAEEAVTGGDAAIRVFTSPEFGRIRAVEINGEPWLVGKDVAEILGYERCTKAIVDRVDVEDRIMLDSKTQSQIGIELGQRGGWVINESGLYSLILSSKLPTAKQFKRWVTAEVLPALRKHGTYTVGSGRRQRTLPTNFSSALRMLADEVEYSTDLENQIEADRPKVQFANDVSGYDKTVSVGDFAKTLCKDGRIMGRNNFYAWMREQKIVDSRNIPYQSQIKAGHFEVIEVRKNGDFYPATRITGKGQLYLHRKFMAQYT